MKKFKPIITMTATVAVLGFLTTTSTVEAANELKSEANIEFIEGTGIPALLNPANPGTPETPSDPLDPDDPGFPDDIILPEAGDRAGSLTLDAVTPISFGPHEISGKTEEYKSTSTLPYIQVTDRRGTGAGWDVTANLSPFTKVNEEGVEIETGTLPGSTLTFTNGEALTNGLQDNDTEPTVTNEIALTAEKGSQSVVTAAEGTGLGSWITRWFHPDSVDSDQGIVLTVPGGSATTGTHTADITWTLESTPVPE